MIFFNIVRQNSFNDQTILYPRAITGNPLIDWSVSNLYQTIVNTK
jgi:hypothetical protein